MYTSLGRDRTSWSEGEGALSPESLCGGQQECGRGIASSRAEGKEFTICNEGSLDTPICSWLRVLRSTAAVSAYRLGNNLLWKMLLNAFHKSVRLSFFAFGRTGAWPDIGQSKRSIRTQHAKFTASSIAWIDAGQRRGQQALDGGMEWHEVARFLLPWRPPAPLATWGASLVLAKASSDQHRLNVADAANSIV